MHACALALSRWAAEMSGPTSVLASAGWPTVRAAALAAKAVAKRS